MIVQYLAVMRWRRQRLMRFYEPKGTRWEAVLRVLGIGYMGFVIMAFLLLASAILLIRSYFN
jgi:hypothetical protein